MLKQLFCGHAEIRVLLEAVIEEVFHDGRGALGDRRAVILHNAKERGHRVEEVEGRLALEEFNDSRSHGPRLIREREERKPW
jgi:hypothetical protein